LKQAPVWVKRFGTKLNPNPLTHRVPHREHATSSLHTPTD